jgi:hypothetical protein
LRASVLGGIHTRRCCDRRVHDEPPMYLLAEDFLTSEVRSSAPAVAL